MPDEIKVFLVEPYVDNLISIIGVILTIATIYIGIKQVNKTYRDSLLLEQKSNMLEQAGKLPLITTEFIRTASLAISYNIKFSNTEASEDRLLFEQNDKKQRELLDEIMYLIIAYGSENSIRVFTEFSFSLKEYLSTSTTNLTETILMYYSLPLLVSLVKYDVTGEIVNPKVMYELLMPEFQTLNPPITDDLIEKNNDLVEAYNLPEEFLWESSNSLWSWFKGFDIKDIR